MVFAPDSVFPAREKQRLPCSLTLPEALPQARKHQLLPQRMLWFLFGCHQKNATPKSLSPVTKRRLFRPGGFCSAKAPLKTSSRRRPEVGISTPEPRASQTNL